MSILDNVRKYFINKKNGEHSIKAPKGVCPTCWGRTEWEGKFYEIIKDEKAIPGSSIYENFISEVVNDHVLKTHNLQDKYICSSCNQEIPE